ncbi:MAG: hypothetical protein QM214_07160 [Bacillota bacterium]|jgi:hypothetical protein|nr:hypothetical protein [Bacillota bacterium]HHU43494.1 hypothetical protein [Clostridiales bacterium]
MFVNQIAVFLENRAGRINEFAQCLAKANINMIAMSIADTTDYGILRVITDDNEKAMKVLKEGGFNIASTYLVGFEVDDKPGAMQRVIDILDKKQINIGYLYSFVRPIEKKAIILIKVDDNEYVANILRENGITLIERNIL